MSVNSVQQSSMSATVLYNLHPLVSGVALQTLCSGGSIGCNVVVRPLDNTSFTLPVAAVIARQRIGHCCSYGVLLHLPSRVWVVPLPCILYDCPLKQRSAIVQHRNHGHFRNTPSQALAIIVISMWLFRNNFRQVELFRVFSCVYVKHSGIWRVWETQFRASKAACLETFRPPRTNRKRTPSLLPEEYFGKATHELT